MRILLPLTEYDSASPKAATAMRDFSKTYGALVLPRVATRHFGGEVRSQHYCVAAPETLARTTRIVKHCAISRSARTKTRPSDR